MNSEMKYLIIDDEAPVLLRTRSQDEIHDYYLGSVAGSEGVEPDDTKTSEPLHGGVINIKRFLISVVAVLVTTFAGLVGAQSTARTAQVDQTSQTKQNQKISKQKPSATKAVKAQNKKTTTAQDAAYAAAYKAGIPHSNTPAEPK
jgi:hypothetical protein